MEETKAKAWISTDQNQIKMHNNYHWKSIAERETSKEHGHPSLTLLAIAKLGGELDLDIYL